MYVGRVKGHLTVVNYDKENGGFSFNTSVNLPP